MSSAQSADDRTARARIRDAAIARFGEVGVDKATVREIAAAAAVSPGLVLHHFGSKQGLRAACDEYVVAEFQRSRTEAVKSGSTDPFAAMSDLEKEMPHLRYLSRALREGSPAANRLFDDIVRESERVMELSIEQGVLRPSRNLHDQAVLLVAWQFGALVLHEHVARGFGVEPFSPELTPRLAQAALEVLTHGVFADARYEDAWERVPTSGEPPPPEQPAQQPEPAAPEAAEEEKER